MSVNTRSRTTLTGRHPELTASPLKPFGARRARNREALAGILFVLPTLVIFGLFKFLPIFGAGAMSLTEYSLNGDFEFLGADNYTRLAADPNFWQSLKVTFLYVAIFVPFIIAVSLAGAVLLDKLVRFSGTFRALLFIPYLSSFVMAGIIWTWIFSTDGPLNAALGGLGMGPVPFTSGPQLLVLLSLAVVSVWKGFGYSMLIFLAGLKAQPAEVHEAARIDGAGAWKSFWYVTLPLLKPVVFFVLVIETIVGFQVFDTIYVMTGGGPANATHLFATYAYQIGVGTGLLSQGAAISLAMFPILFLVVVIQLLYIRRVEVR